MEERDDVIHSTQGNIDDGVRQKASFGIAEALDLIDSITTRTIARTDLLLFRTQEQRSLAAYPAEQSFSSFRSASFEKAAGIHMI